MFLGNAKRMHMIHGILRENKKKKRSTSSTHRKKRTEIPEVLFVDTSGSSKSSSFRSSSSQSVLAEINTSVMKYQGIERVQANWRTIQQSGDTTDFGERLVYKMIESDPGAKPLMRIESTHCERVHHLSVTLVSILESILFTLGPLCDLEDLFQEAFCLKEEGVSPDLLADVLPICVNTTLGGTSPDDEMAWRQSVVPTLRLLEKVLQESPGLNDSDMISMLSGNSNYFY
mmetsp:Transcript_11380/g.21729  ORF Transcript_11380/g.21729 Transcript_11380/m.21729 type:complete len:230 (-) Transcript_11380:72-761(-)